MNRSAFQAFSIDQVFAVVEVDEAGFFVGDLFRRRFGTDSFPDSPRHFVAFAKLPGGAMRTLGYVHYTRWQGCELCGGLVIDDRQYRRLPPRVRKPIRETGGVAELLLRETFTRLPGETVAIWGHVGNTQSEKVCLRVGFEHTPSEYVMAVWRDPSLSEEEKQLWVERAAGLGPF